MVGPRHGGPTNWFSGHHYPTEVTEADMLTMRLQQTVSPIPFPAADLPLG